MKNSEKAVSNSRLRQTIRVFFSRGLMSKICFGIIVAFVLLAILAPVLAPYSPTEQSLIEALQKPSATHWFGTDNLGRDLLSRILYGARISLVSSLLSSLIAAALGTFLGLVAGYFEGLLSQVIMRVIDAQLSSPPLFKHALRNALIPIITVVALQVRVVVGGSLIVEQVFNIAGIGALMQQAVGNRDYLIVQGSVLVISLVTVGCNLLVDILYGFVDPRIRKAKR